MGVYPSKIYCQYVNLAYVIQLQNGFSLPKQTKDLDPSYLPKQSKDLDPSYKTILDLWDCFGRENLCVITEEMKRYGSLLVLTVPFDRNLTVFPR